jgi:septum formation protein
VADARPHVVLASGSRFRRQMLEAAGLTFDVVTAVVDEAELRARFARETPPPSPAAVAMRLAEEKARRVARLQPHALVIGADQVLALDGTIYAKPASVVAARAHLRTLRGRRHELPTAAVIVRDEQVLWSGIETPALTMRPFSDLELEAYLTSMGDTVTETVGAYKLEGLGANLMERIEGDYFSIIGLPLLPLLAALRDLGAARL